MGTGSVKNTVKGLLSPCPFLYSHASRSYKRFKSTGEELRWRVAALRSRFSPLPPHVTADNSAPCVAVTGPEKPGIKIITTLEELDAQLVLVDEAGQRSDDDLRKALASFEFGLTQNVPADPYGEAYRKQQHELYLTISGAGSYSAENERSAFLGNPEETARQPFPYYTRSAQTVGDQFMALGYIIKTMNLAAGSKILEFGPGWGNTTITLARMGYAVTAVDIEPKFLELIQCRAKMLGLSVHTVCDSFGPVYDADGEPEKFDAVLFFECFHHCADHLKLIQQLPAMIKDEGIVVFASEPITEDFPLPWGVRLDGMSVWSIRRFKWLELGFKESYFVRTMLKNGWVVDKKLCADTHLGVIFIARRNSGRYELSRFLLPKDEDVSWAPPESVPEVGVRYTAGASQITLDEDDRWHFAAIQLVNSAPFALDVKVRCGSQSVRAQFAPREEKALILPLDRGERRLLITSPSWSPKQHNLNADGRTLGVAVRSIQFLADGSPGN